MEKKLVWVDSSERDHNKFPTEIKETMLHALNVALEGGRALGVRTFSGSGDASIVEIKDRDESGIALFILLNSQRAVFVLHAFKKKSKSGKQRQNKK